MSNKKCILRISIASITVGLSTFAPQQAIASEINFNSQMAIQTTINHQGNYPGWNFNRSYPIAQTNLNSEKFCIDYPYNSLCEDRDTVEPVEVETVPVSNTANADNSDNWAILTNASTLGLGGAVVAKINPHLNTRVGINAFGFDLTYDETRASYDSEVNLFNIGTTLDYYPFEKSGFNVSLGVIYNDNNADGVAVASDIVDVDLGAFNIDVNDLLNVNAKVETSRNFAPYLGIGWGNPIAGSLRLWGNLGVMFPGSPEVELSPDFLLNQDIVPDNIKQEIQDNLDEEEESIEEDLDRFNIYPVVSIGLSYSL